MRSSRVKLLHAVGGLPVIGHVVASARGAGARRIVAVLGAQGEEVRAAIEAAPAGGRKSVATEFCVQSQQLGTAHAVMAAEKLLGREKGTLLILNGDVPLVLPSTLKAFIALHRRRKAALTVMTTELDDPTGYGRVLRDGSGGLKGIREHADIRGRRELLAIREINAGLYCVEMEGLFRALKATSRGNAQNEYYLPDLVEVLRRDGRRVEAMLHLDPEEVLGINDRVDLARAIRELYRRRALELMQSGVTLIDPEATWVDAGVKVGKDTIIHPGVRLEGATRVGSGCTLRAGVRVTGSIVGDGAEILDHCLVTDSVIGRDCSVGPFAHLRPGTKLGNGVRIGNFVETKKAVIGNGSKANHLSYLGDAEIGKGVNVGAGTITCNYDGWDKHRTVLEDGVFIGSDSQLVAPVKIGKGAFVGAGTTITKDVPPDALAISRARQQTIEGWAFRKRRERAASPKRKKR
jgi:bifunctional UDP-N-acetylglucosamine pyrophosphorylase/glucosamine-1-phosphate N-acetyltransferase